MKLILKAYLLLFIPFSVFGKLTSSTHPYGIGEEVQWGQDNENIIVVMLVDKQALQAPESIIIRVLRSGGLTETLQVVTESGFNREITLPCPTEKDQGQAKVNSAGLLKITLPKDKSRLSGAMHPSLHTPRKTEITVERRD